MMRGVTASVAANFGFAGALGMEDRSTSMLLRSDFVPPKPSRLDVLVLQQNNRFRRFWEVLLALVLVYVATLLPFKITFLEGAVFGVCEAEGDWDNITGEWANMTMVCTAEPEAVSVPAWERLDTWFMEPFFIVDVFINFFFSFQDSHGREVVSLRACVKRYLSKHFWIDIVACIPSFLISMIVNAIAGVDSDGGSNDSSGQNLAKIGKLRVVQRATKLTRLVRLARLVKIVSFLNQSEMWMRMKDLRSVRLLNVLVGLCWAVHIFACVWYYVAVMHDDKVNTWLGQRSLYDGTVLITKQQPVLAWIHACYFVMTTFTTVGFGDMSAKTVGEMGFVMLLMIAGIFVNSIILSAAIDIWNSVDETAQAVDEQKRIVEGFGEHTHLASRRIFELKDSVGQAAPGTNYDRTKMKSLITSSALPRDIITQLPKEIFHGELEKNRFVTCCSAVYRRLPPRFSLLVALWCNPRSYQRNEVVYYCHDHSWNVFLVFEGVFAALAIATPAGGTSAIPPAGLNAFEALNRKSRRAKKDSQPPICNVVASSSMVERGEATTLSPYKLFTARSFFGDAEVLLEPGPRRASNRCESKKGTLLVLSKTDILDLLQEFPPCADAWRIASRRREKHEKAALRRLTWAPMSRPPDVHRTNGWFPYEDFAATIIGREWRKRWKPRSPRNQGQGRGYALSQVMRQAIVSRKSMQVPKRWVPDFAQDLSTCVESLRTEVADMRGKTQVELSSLHEAMRELRADIARMPDASGAAPV